MGTSTHDLAPRRWLMIAAGALVVVAILVALAMGTTGGSARVKSPCQCFGQRFSGTMSHFGSPPNNFVK